jgi:hypothetical protein
MFTVTMRRTTLAVEDRQSDVIAYDATASLRQAYSMRDDMLYHQLIEGGTYIPEADVVVNEDEETVYHVAIEPA